MLITQSSFAVLALAQTVTAFIPWLPDYRCKLLNNCADKREERGAYIDARGLEHVEIIQRVAEVQSFILQAQKRTTANKLDRTSSPTMYKYKD